MLSGHQVMNSSFNPVRLVNTYGVFGSVTRVRNEIVIEGTNAAAVGTATVWREYEFRGKPGDPARKPGQFAPYHLQLDWMMWFAALSSPAEEPWFSALLRKILQGDRAVLGLLRSNPFGDQPPRALRASYYRYTFTTPDERRRTGRWWNRERTGLYYRPVRLRGSALEGLDP
jgi:hypothetical protein